MWSSYRPFGFSAPSSVVKPRSPPTCSPELELLFQPGLLCCFPAPQLPPLLNFTASQLLVSLSAASFQALGFSAVLRMPLSWHFRIGLCLGKKCDWLELPPHIFLLYFNLWNLGFSSFLALVVLRCLWRVSQCSPFSWPMFAGVLVCHSLPLSEEEILKDVFKAVGAAFWITVKVCFHWWDIYFNFSYLHFKQNTVKICWTKINMHFHYNFYSSGAECYFNFF